MKPCAQHKRGGVCKQRHAGADGSVPCGVKTALILHAHKAHARAVKAIYADVAVAGEILRTDEKEALRAAADAHGVHGAVGHRGVGGVLPAVDADGEALYARAVVGILAVYMYVVRRTVAVEVVVHALPLRERHRIAERHSGVILAENAGVCVKADGAAHFPVVKFGELSGAEEEAEPLIVQRPCEGGGVGKIGIECVLHLLKPGIWILGSQRRLQQRAQLCHVGHNVAHGEDAPGRGVKVRAVIIVIAVHAAGEAGHAVKYADGAAVGARQGQIVIAVERLKRRRAALAAVGGIGGLRTVRRCAAVIVVRCGRQKLPVGGGAVRRAVAVE